MGNKFTKFVDQVTLIWNLIKFSRSGSPVATRHILLVHTLIKGRNGKWAWDSINRAGGGGTADATFAWPWC